MGKTAVAFSLVEGQVTASERWNVSSGASGGCLVVYCLERDCNRQPHRVTSGRINIHNYFTPDHKSLNHVFVFCFFPSHLLLEQ